MYTKLFWKDVFERTVSTVAQVLIALFSADGFNLLNLDVEAVVVTVAISAALVVLKALVAANVSRTVSPASLVKKEN